MDAFYLPKQAPSWGKSLLAGCLALVGSTLIAQTTVTFSYTGTAQPWIVPAGVVSIDVDVMGAQGGTGYPAVHQGGNGGRVTANIPVTPGQVLEVYVGGAGGNGSASVAGAGGYNGGAVSAIYSGSYSGGGGGGASDIRVSPYTLADRLVVAGGGGGGGYNYGTTNYDRGGGGGGLTGETGYGGNVLGGTGAGTGGSQVAGGIGGTYGGWCTASNGASGIGGAGGSCTNGGGGGGGGYFGGGGATWSGAGGGSSYVTSSGSNIAHTQGVRPGNGEVIITYTVIIVDCDTLTGLTANPSMFCPGSTVDLSAVTTTDSIDWYDAPTGGNFLGRTASGANLPVSPSGTTTYYAEVVPLMGVPTTMTFNYTGSIQNWVVPSGVTSINIDARGAQGGGSYNGAGGMGARMVGDYTVTPGEDLSIVVGQQGLLQVGGNSQNSSGGGGGTFVFSTISQNLLVASGGGGGKCNYTGSSALHAGAAGQVTTSGGASSDGNPGGTAGNGGPAGNWSSVPCSGGGTGWLSVGGGPYGGTGYNTWTGGPGYCGGGGGGCGGVGGFGGGGGGGNHYGGGGGGGGYSGGGGGTDPTHGGGGGSFSIGTSQNNTPGYQTGNGIVIFTYTGPSCTVPARQAVTVYPDSIAPIASCQNITVTLDSTGNASITAMDIDGGSADNCTLDSISTSVSSFGCLEIGANNVVLTVYDDSGYMDSCTAVVTVDAPALAASFSFSVGAAGLQYDFTDLSTGATAWAWDFGDGQTSSSQNPSNTYAVDGSYTVCLTVTGACGEDTTCQSVTVVSNARPFGAGMVQLWPNPTHGQFNVRVEGLSGDKLVMELYNLAGQRVMNREYSQVASSMTETFHTDLPAGTYFLRVSDGVNHASLRVVIE